MRSCSKSGKFWLIDALSLIQLSQKKKKMLMEYLPWARSFGYHSHWSLPFHPSRQCRSAGFITFTCRMPESHTQLPVCSSPHKVTFVKAFLWLCHNPASILLLSPQINAVFTSWFCICNPLWQCVLTYLVHMANSYSSLHTLLSCAFPVPPLHFT